MNITRKDIEVAYRKLKSYIYYDNTLLNVRIKLAEFEAANLKKKLNDFYEYLKDYYKQGNSLASLLDQIDFSLYPKQFCKEENSEQDYSNQIIQEKYVIKRISIFIDCPIEVYLISVLWIMKVGYHLDNDVNESCFANRIDHFEEYDVWSSNSKLFNIYYYKYSEWRDRAIKKAKELHNSADCILLTLDIKEYFNSVDLLLDDLFPDPDYEWLNKLLAAIHERYSEILFNNKLIDIKKHILPIGLMSSYILANYYLKEFDNYVNERFKPAYYGRYVDDIILLFKHDSSKPAQKEIYLDKYFFNPKNWQNEVVSVSKTLTESEDNYVKTKAVYCIIINGNRLLIQEEKVKYFHFSKSNSINILLEFEKEIAKNSSEFRLEPVEESVFENFETSSYRISYSDSINKLRSIESFSTNKLGASKHLSKIIEATKYAKQIKKDSISNIFDQITDYFSGMRSIEFHSLWEKIFTFFTITKSEKQLIEFANDQIENILNLDLHESYKRDKKLSETYLNNIKLKLVYHLLFCFSMAASLSMGFFNRRILKKIIFPIADGNNEIFLKGFALPQINKYSKSLVSSNLFRHHYGYYPLFNYCKQSPSFSFINEKIPRRTNFTIDKNKLKYSPRFISLHEFVQFYFLRLWYSNRRNTKFVKDPLNICVKEFNKFTFDYYSKIYKLDLKIFKPYKRFQRVIVNDSNPKSELKIGLVNIQVFPKNSFASMHGNPRLSFKRLSDINQVLNFGLKTKCDLIIFPEMSIPIQWLDNILRFCRNNQIGVICGMEHFQNSKREVFNYLATILPFEKKLNEHHIYKNALLDLRLKKDYSPEEVEIIKKYRMRIPSYQSKEHLRLYKWRSTFFSTLNCFELSDLEKRIVFKGEVDFLGVIEHNKDVDYFSSIVESIARDIHAYIIQVNSSNYGDSRITLPASSYNRDQAKIKGGKDVTIITGHVNIKSLREFQSNPAKFNGKVNKIEYKPLPANFKMSKLRKSI